MSVSELIRKLLATALLLTLLVVLLVRNRGDMAGVVWQLLRMVIGLAIIWLAAFLGEIDVFDTETAQMAASPPAWLWEIAGWILFLAVGVPVVIVMEIN
jgi:hypothetical protein